MAAEPEIPARTFESILHALKPSDALLEDLKSQGYSPGNLHTPYTAETWRRVLETLRRHRFPGAPPEQADRLLGHAFLDGFSETIVGRVICLMLPLLGPERMLASFPHYATYGRPDARIEMKPEDTRTWRAVVHMPLGLPHFTAGVLERGLGRTGVRGTVEVQNHRGDDFDLLARWRGPERRLPGA